MLGSFVNGILGVKETSRLGRGVLTLALSSKRGSLSPLYLWERDRRGRVDRE